MNKEEQTEFLKLAKVGESNIAPNIMNSIDKQKSKIVDHLNTNSQKSTMISAYNYRQLSKEEQSYYSEMETPSTAKVIMYDLNESKLAIFALIAAYFIGYGVIKSTDIGAKSIFDIKGNIEMMLFVARDVEKYGNKSYALMVLFPAMYIAIAGILVVIANRILTTILIKLNPDTVLSYSLKK